MGLLLTVMAMALASAASGMLVPPSKEACILHHPCTSPQRLRLPLLLAAGGVRQSLHNTYSDGRDPDIKINEGGVSDYFGQIKASKFCLSPYGHGWGIRTNLYMANGCVPVVIQDHVYQPYESVLPYQEFSIRLAKSDIPKVRFPPACLLPLCVAASATPAAQLSQALVQQPRPTCCLLQQHPCCRAQIGDILRNVSDAELLRLRSNLPKYYRAFIWEPQHGGLAYNYTIAALHKRSSQLIASHYH